MQLSGTCLPNSHKALGSNPNITKKKMLGLVVCAYNPSTQELKQEGCEFKGSLG